MMYTYVIEVGKRFNDSKLSTAMHNDITVILYKKKYTLKCINTVRVGFEQRKLFKTLIIIQIFLN